MTIEPANNQLQNFDDSLFNEASGKSQSITFDNKDLDNKNYADLISKFDDIFFEDFMTKAKVEGYAFGFGEYTYSLDNFEFEDGIVNGYTSVKYAVNTMDQDIKFYYNSISEYDFDIEGETGHYSATQTNAYKGNDIYELFAGFDSNNIMDLTDEYNSESDIFA